MNDIQPFIEPAKAIDGWMSNSELTWLAKQALDCHIIIEIGCYKGRSTRALADHCPGTVYAIDPWSGTYYKNNDEPLMDIGEKIYNEFKQNLIDRDNLIICRGILSEFTRILPTADMIFIDGDHRYEQVKFDIEESLKLLKPNGLLCGHDYTHTDWPGVKQVVDELYPNAEHTDSIWFARIR